METIRLWSILFGMLTFHDQSAQRRHEIMSQANNRWQESKGTEVHKITISRNYTLFWHSPVWSNSRTSILTWSCSNRFLILVQNGQVVLEKTITLLAATSLSTVSMGEEAMGAMVAKLLKCWRRLRTGKLATGRSGTITSLSRFGDLRLGQTEPMCTSISVRKNWTMNVEQQV